MQYASFSALPFCHLLQLDCSHFTCLPTGFIKLKLPDRLGFCRFFLATFSEEICWMVIHACPLCSECLGSGEKPILKSILFFTFPCFIWDGFFAYMFSEKGHFCDPDYTEGGQEVSFSINPSNISFGLLIVSLCQQLSWNGKKWCYRTYILPWMFKTRLSFLKRNLRETGFGVI